MNDEHSPMQGNLLFYILGIEKNKPSKILEPTMATEAGSGQQS